MSTSHRYRRRVIVELVPIPRSQPPPKKKAKPVLSPHRDAYHVLLRWLRTEQQRSIHIYIIICIIISVHITAASASSGMSFNGRRWPCTADGSRASTRLAAGHNGTHCGRNWTIPTHRRAVWTYTGTGSAAHYLLVVSAEWTWHLHV